VQDREAADEGVKVARAALVRAQVQKEYQVLRAPFDGTVTARFADPGTLLPAATGSTSSAQPLLEVAQLDRLRVALHLGQDDAARVRVGDKVQLQTSRDQPPFEARISRISQSLDPRTRTMMCESDLPQPPEGLYPGAFGPWPGLRAPLQATLRTSEAPMLKKIALTVVVLLAILAIVIATRPAEYRVSRSQSIDAPANGVYAQVADFHRWKAWSPWEKL